MRRNILCLLLVVMILLSGCHSSSEPSTSTIVSTTASPVTNDTTHTTGTSFTPPPSTETDNTVSTTGGSTNITTATNGTAITTLTDKTASIGSVTTRPTITTTTSINNDFVTFKATIRENVNRQPIKGVTVTVYTDFTSTPAATDVTDQNGVVQVTISRGASYKVVLSDLPTGYEAEPQYLFSTATVNIIINKSSVRNEQDHSNALYKKGDVMTDFSMTDTDGNSHQLSTLLKEKQLVILDFWYVSCEPCKSEFPLFEAAIDRYGDKITLLAINPFDSQRTIANLRKQLNEKPITSIHFPMLQDTCNLYAGFSVSTYPTTVFIDADGVIQHICEGAFSSKEELFAIIERYLY